VLIAITLDLPFYLLAAHFTMSVIGLYEFTAAHGMKPTWKTPLVMALGYLPYQWVLAYASMRATIRHLRGVNNWEKTQHVGAHRQAGETGATASPQERAGDETTQFAHRQAGEIEATASRK